LITNKIKTEKIKINLETDKMRLFGKKNSLIVKKEELRIEITALNAAGPSNIPIYRYQNPFLKPTQDKLKAKKPPPFNNLKKNFQKFFTETRYYQGFYQQNLLFDSDKIQDTIVNIIKNVSK